MIGIEDTVKNFPMSWTAAGITVTAKACDSCKSAASILFCKADSAYLCMCCDTKIHEANKLASRHEHVWMCEVCEQAPAAVTCKADAAALCVTCDDDIHSANPLARRHDRVPIQPFFESAASLLKSSSPSSVGAATLTSGGANEFVAAAAAAAVNYLVPSNDEVEAASWILPDTDVITTGKVYDAKVLKNGDDAFFSDFDHLLDFDYHNTINHHYHQQHQYNHGADSLVPVQQIFNINNNNNNGNNNCNSNIKNKKNQGNEASFEIDFCNSKLTPFNYTTTATKTQSITHSISSSSLLDVGIVPDGSGASETSFSFGKQTTTNSNVTGGESQLFGMDREARVLRYREKRKNRKFEKTIRYASRKAYAETRPRIKGRFAKRSETESEEIDVDGLFVPVGSATFMTDPGYGVVPSF